MEWVPTWLNCEPASTTDKRIPASRFCGTEPAESLRVYSVSGGYGLEAEWYGVAVGVSDREVQLAAGRRDKAAQRGKEEIRSAFELGYFGLGHAEQIANLGLGELAGLADLAKDSRPSLDARSGSVECGFGDRIGLHGGVVLGHRSDCGVVLGGWRRFSADVSGHSVGIDGGGEQRVGSWGVWDGASCAGHRLVPRCWIGRACVWLVQSVSRLCASATLGGYHKLPRRFLPPPRSRTAPMLASRSMVRAKSMRITGGRSAYGVVVVGGVRRNAY